MYYINKDGQYGIARKVKTFAQFYKSNPAEGSLWGVRKRAKIDNFSYIDQYIIKSGKLRKTGTTHVMWGVER